MAFCWSLSPCLLSYLSLQTTLPRVKDPSCNSPDLPSTWKRKGWHQAGRGTFEPESGWVHGKAGCLLLVPVQLQQWGICHVHSRF